MKKHSLEVLGLISHDLRKIGKKIVLANGCFDLMHPGHIYHLQAAKKLGDVLMVSVTQDAHINKGPNRPIFNIDLRCDSLMALECVDYIAVNSPVPGEAIEIIKPDFYVKGQEYRGHITTELAIEKQVAEKWGGQLVFTEEPEFHSTRLIDLISRLAPTDENRERNVAYESLQTAMR